MHNYWYNQYKEVLPVKDAKVTVLEGPKHGVIDASNLVTEMGPYFEYGPDHGFLGEDKITFLVEVAGKRVKVVATMIVESNHDIHDLPCPAYIQRLNSIDNPGNFADVAATLDASIQSSLNVDASFITVTFADLPGGAVGQTIGTNITLDDNAAGNGWFIDTTPADNSEFLPTSNPNEWVAKAGSAAAGKMDMLSVLLHEYGHALGIEHSADSGDYMGTTLTVGVRRLPSATELALMQQLIGQAKDGLASATTLPNNTPDNTPAPFPTLPISLGGLAFAGLLRPNRYGSLTIDTLSASPSPTGGEGSVQYEAAANATFTNLDTANAWQTQGSVDITPSSFDTSGRTVINSATLNEVSTAQTRLSQVFMLNDNDCYLSFTLSGSALDNPVGAPDSINGVRLD